MCSSDLSQQFLPWYLAWAFIWLPLIKESWWKAWLIILSLTGLLRYVPWILAGEHNDLVLANQKWMLWGVALGLWFLWHLWFLWNKMRYNDPR